MNKSYTGTFVLNLKGSEEGVDDLVEHITAELKAEGAQIQKTDRLGRKEYAYPNFDKQTHGFFINCHFEAAPSVIEKVRSKLALREDIHLQHYRVA